LLASLVNMPTTTTEIPIIEPTPTIPAAEITETLAAETSDPAARPQRTPRAETQEDRA
jgi:glycine betaine/proline transport system ATP-binding protein